jgi:hypothetical protein
MTMVESQEERHRLAQQLHDTAEKWNKGACTAAVTFSISF